MRFRWFLLICVIFLAWSSDVHAVTWIKVNDQSSGFVDAGGTVSFTMDCTPGAEIMVAGADDVNNNGTFDQGIDNVVSSIFFVDGSFKDEDTRPGYYKETVDGHVGWFAGKRTLWVATEIGSGTCASCAITFRYPSTTQGVRGRITNSDGTPAADIPVGALYPVNVSGYFLDYPSDGQEAGLTRTDANGNYTLYLPQAGQYMVWTEDSPALTYVYDSEAYHQVLSVTQNAFVQNVNFQLPSREPAPPTGPNAGTCIVSGRVTDEFSRPLPFASIFSSAQETFTDLTGHYSMSLPRGTNYLGSELNGFFATNNSDITVTGNTTIDLVLRRASSWIGGTVTDSTDGHPISVVEVHAEPHEQSTDWISASDTTTALGKYLCWTDDGYYDVHGYLHMPSHGQFNGSATIIGGSVLNISLNPANAKLVGTVTDSNGAPLQGVRVDTGADGLIPYAASSMTGPDGRYSVCMLPGADYAYVVFTKPGYQDVNLSQATFSSNETRTLNQQLTFISNPPILSGGKVMPAYGNTSTDFTFEVTYTDRDNNPPSVMMLDLSAHSYTMSKADPSDTNYTDGVKYVYTTKLPVFSHYYRFLATDSTGVPSINAMCEREEHSGPYVLSSWIPTNDGLTPISGSLMASTKYTFAAKYTDNDGTPDISYCNLLLNTTTGISTNSVYARYDVVNNRLYLRNDANTGWLGGFAPGTSNIIENSQCRIYCAETTKSTSGNQISVNWKIEIKPSMVGKTLMEWMYVSDREAHTDGWSKVGSVQITQATTHPPVDVSLTPAGGTWTHAVRKQISCVYSDPAGYSDIAYCFLLVNKVLGSGANSVYAVYNQKVNLLYLKNDANTGWMGGFAPGSSNTIENAECKIFCADTTVAKSGNTLTVNWSILPKSGMIGTGWMEWLSVTDKSNLTDGWDKYGTVIVQ